jgi:hypothetical protein
LKTGRELLLTRGWTQAAYARDGNGRVLGASEYDSQGTCFCAIGAVRTALISNVPIEERSFEGPWEFSARAESLLHRAVAPYAVNLFEWNDAPGRTRDEVIALYDRAIQIEENKHAS